MVTAVEPDNLAVRISIVCVPAASVNMVFNEVVAKPFPPVGFTTVNRFQPPDGKNAPSTYKTNSTCEY